MYVVVQFGVVSGVIYLWICEENSAKIEIYEKSLRNFSIP